MSASEIARIRQQIDQEVAAFKLAMKGYAQVSSHDIIAHHYALLSDHTDKLAIHIGRAAALQAVTESLDHQL